MTGITHRDTGAPIDVLIVDDEADLRELLELSLLRMGLTCETAADVAEARACLDQRSYRLCLTDMRLPDGDGIDLVEHIQNHHSGLPVAILTAYGSIETAIRALKAGAFDFLTKPVELKKLRELVSNALKSKDASPQEDAEHGSERAFIGSSQAIQYLREQIRKLARNQAPVYINGESGTGKEVIARLIHAHGPRAAGPFVPVNCGAISPELMESEFFGYRKGAFTGASADKPGLFQAANGGTLFLDEVADLPLPMQVKLLRAIQERAVRPVGAHAEEPVDVRILSASHRDLGQLVGNGSFRQDLYFRINVITLRVPPLRERPEDIPALAEHILERLALRDCMDALQLAPDAIATLKAYAFPGNVRELENLLERACALAEGCVIRGGDVQVEPSMGVPSTADAFPRIAVAAPPLATPVPSTNQASDEEKDRILATLEETRWNRSEAARRLGMTLRQLRYRLQKWGMD